MNEMREKPGKSGKCLHREEYQCTLTDKDKLIPGDGTDCTHSCCWECENHGECRMECYSSANRPENGPEQQPAAVCEPEAPVSAWYEKLNLEEIDNIITTKMKETAENVIIIGYCLRQIDENKLYLQEGHNTVARYAEEKYGMGPAAVSKYIKCNIRFSKNGFSMELDDRYIGFGKSQIQELLSLNSEQLEQVTPDMTVAQIREIRKPKEVPYYPLEGQMEITEFLESEEPVQEPSEAPVSFQMDVSELAPEELEEEAQEAPVMDYNTRGVYCNAFARFLIERFKNWFKNDYENRVLLVTEFEKQLKERFHGTWYFRDPVQGGVAHINLFPEYIQIWDGAGKCLGETEWFYLCASIQGMWNEVALEVAAKMQQIPSECCENSSEEELEEIATSQQDELEVPEEELTDLELLRGMLEKEKGYLEEMIKVNEAEPLPENLIRKKRILVGALAGMLCDLEEPEPEEPEQPPLPLMRNNDQRKEWLRDYKSWGLWYTDDHIGCRYYKYDFDNGARLIAEVYDNYSPFGKMDYESSYLHLVRGPEPDEHPSGAYGRWSRHERYNRFPNSETELVEFLKSIQKGERK